MKDVFEPRAEPARSIYLAFQREAENRQSRDLEEWITAERNAVFQEGQRLAVLLNLKPPTMEDVKRSEIAALGHVDYGSKWAYGVANAMKTGNTVGRWEVTE